jgi:ABC-2 type transport system ATP-binding protein
VARIGVVFGQRTQLWWDLPVVESFELLREIYAVAPPEYRRTRDELVAILGLGPWLDVPVRQLSLGLRMRADLAAALLHAPPLVFLDEPTIGLDAESKLAVRGFITRLNRERGVTVLLTTHDLDDIAAVCSRVLVLGQGRLLWSGSIPALEARVAAERRLVLDLVDPGAGIDDPDVRLVRREGARVELAFDPARVPAATLVGRLLARHAVRDMILEGPSIEEVVARLYREHAP